MAFDTKISKLNSEKISAELEITHKDKILPFGNDSWKIKYVIGGGYIQSTSSSNRLDLTSKGAVTLCKVSNGIELKYAVVRLMYAQADKADLYVLSLSNTVREGLDNLEEQALRVIKKLNLPDQVKYHLEDMLRDKIKRVKESIRK